MLACRRAVPIVHYIVRLNFPIRIVQFSSSLIRPKWPAIRCKIQLIIDNSEMTWLKCNGVKIFENSYFIFLHL